MPDAYELAQVNVAVLKAPLDSPQLADFVAWLGPINALADAAPGFVWRLQSDEGNATSIRIFDTDGLIVNMSVWESIEALQAYVYKSPHIAVLRRRREWFEQMGESHLALWWTPRGERPSIADAEERLLHLRRVGPSAYAFTIKEQFPPPSVPVTTSFPAVPRRLPPDARA